MVDCDPVLVFLSIIITNYNQPLTDSAPVSHGGEYVILKKQNSLITKSAASTIYR